ncbi:MAG: VOC family protein [Ignavibacteriaceae bacterium]
MKLIPYLNFQGDCEEALNTYKEIFSGNIERIERYDNPAMKVPEDYKNKILHAVFKAGDVEFFASDVYPGKTLENSSRIALSLSLDNVDNAEKIFSGLSDKGKINVPFKKQFWGAWHGNLVDRFGVSWMVNCEQ